MSDKKSPTITLHQVVFKHTVPLQSEDGQTQMETSLLATKHWVMRYDRATHELRVFNARRARQPIGAQVTTVPLGNIAGWLEADDLEAL